MKRNLAYVPLRPFSPPTLALGLSFGLALAACSVVAADATNTAVPPPRAPVPTKLVVPPEWKVKAEIPDFISDNLPLVEVSRNLQAQCQQQFDVLIPKDPVPVAPQPSPDGIPPPPELLTNPWGATSIGLRLNNVNVIEVFQAMNMLFEIERKPLRWELVMNGRRPVAVLHELESAPPSAVPAGGTQTPPSNLAISRSVVFVGDLLGGPDSGGMKPDTLCEILKETVGNMFPASSTPKIQFHRAAELLVLSGTDEELRFMKDVLQALKEKSNHQLKRNTAGAQEPPAKK